MSSFNFHFNVNFAEVARNLSAIMFFFFLPGIVLAVGSGWLVFIPSLMMGIAGAGLATHLSTFWIGFVIGFLYFVGFVVVYKAEVNKAPGNEVSVATVLTAAISATIWGIVIGLIFL